MKLLPVNFMKSTINFGESDGDYYYYSSPELSKSVTEIDKSIKKEIIKEKYRKYLAELASWADDDEMSNADFWREYRRIEAEKDREIRNLDLYC